MYTIDCGAIEPKKEKKKKFEEMIPDLLVGKTI